MVDDRVRRALGSAPPLGRDRTRRLALRAAALLAAPIPITALAAHDLLYNGAGGLDWAVALAVVWSLLARRAAPLLTFAASLAGFLTLVALDGPPFAGVALLVALYSVAAHRGLLLAVLAAAALEAGIVLVALQQAPARSIDDTIVLLTAAAAAATLLGTTMRTQRRFLAASEDRAAQLVRDRHQATRLAAADERARIAREMHDIVAHGLAVVVALADGAAARAIAEPEVAQRAMRQVSAAGRQSLQEMRTLLRVLRTDEPAGPAPQPDLRDLADLLDEVGSTGLSVHAQVEELDHLDPGLQLTIHRLVQEALTNVLKHAPTASHVDVTVHRDGPAIRFHVADDGRPAVHPVEAADGRGLRGMAERVALYGGSVTAGPSPAGWVVEGSLQERGAP